MLFKLFYLFQIKEYENFNIKNYECSETFITEQPQKSSFGADFKLFPCNKSI